MPKSQKILIISATGIAVALLVAIVETLIGHFTGYNIFGFSVYFVVPVGAIAIGAAAASGYFFACRKLQMRPGIFLVAQMIVVAAATNFLIYYFEYLAVTWGYPVAFDMNIFSQYLTEYFTHQQYSIRTWSLGEVGYFGYLLAGRNFLGFLIGGAVIVFALRGEPKCPTCSLYYSTRVKRNRFFRAKQDALKYYAGLFALPLGGEEFVQRVSLGEPAMELEAGTVRVETRVLHCPRCRQQRWQDKGEEWDGKNWKGIDEISRAILISKGVDVSGLFEAAPDEASKHDALFAPR